MAAATRIGAEPARAPRGALMEPTLVIHFRVA
jgi:hypothetical protein